MPCNEVVHGALLIKDSPTDAGTRPFADGDSEPYWNSPSIRLVGGVDDGTAKVGAQNTIVVTVANISQNPLSDVSVEVWVCDFTMGVSPASSLTSSNPGGQALTGFFSGPLAPGAQHDISTSPWTPVAADAALNGGHVCIAANCYADGDGEPLSAEGNAFQFLCDTHHAQRNIHVAAVAPQMHRFNFRMTVVNPNPRLGALTHVQLQHVVGLKAVTPGLRNWLLNAPDVIYGVVRAPATTRLSQPISHELITPAASLATAGPGLPFELAHLTAPAVAAAEITAARNQFLVKVDATHYVPLAFSPILPTSMGIAAPGVGKGTLLNFNLKEAQKATMEVDIELSPQARPGDVHAFDLTQHSPQGDVLGGARIILIVK